MRYQDAGQWTQLTRSISKGLRRRVKEHCIIEGTLIQDFIVTALEKKLAQKPRRTGRK